jgi:tetratricopeptide (TPR) repeat protein
MNRALALLLAALLPLAAVAQSNHGERVEDRLPGRLDPDLLGDLRITLPGESVRVTPDPSTAKVFLPPELAMRTDTNAVSAIQRPLPLLKSTYSSEVNVHMVRAMENMSSNQVFVASRELWQAARLAPHLPEPAAGLALTYLLAEDNDRAARLLEKLVVAYPSDADLRFNLASARYGQKRHAEALDLLMGLEGQDRFPDKLYYNMAMNLLALGEPSDALRALRTAFDRNPRTPAPLLAMARIHARRAEPEAMLFVLRMARPLIPADQRAETFADPAFQPYTRRPEFQALLAP